MLFICVWLSVVAIYEARPDAQLQTDQVRVWTPYREVCVRGSSACDPRKEVKGTVRK
jgi:hypothetical protein